jgi:hypothetical protein
VKRVVGLEFLAGIQAAEEGFPSARRIAEQQSVVLQFGPGAEAQQAVLERRPPADEDAGR